MSNPVRKILNWYFSKSSLPHWMMVILDSMIVFLSGFLVYWMFYRGYQTLVHSYRLANAMLLYVVISWIGMRMFHTYAGVVRYSSFVDLSRVAYANTVSLFIALVVHYPVFKLPASSIEHLQARHLVAIFVLATLVMWSVRVIVKTVYDILSADGRALRVLIYYGSMSSGVSLAKAIRVQSPQRFRLKGFLTDDPHDSNDQLLGEKVYGTGDNLEYIIMARHIQAVLVSPERNYEFRNDQDLQDILINRHIRIFMASEARETSKDFKEPQIHMREVNVEDLLPRDEIHVDLVNVANELKDKRILITGAAGSIGSEIVRQVASFKPEAMMLIDQAETPEHDIRLLMQKEFPDIKAETVVTSICKETRMEQIFRDFRPAYVFHAAAYKHVPMMEDNPSEAVQNNVYGTKVIADLSVKYGVKKFVMVSTDKAVNPTNVMGCSKRICEIYVQSLNYAEKNGGAGQRTQFVTTRFGNVLGSNGSVIPLFREQIKNGGPVTVTDPHVVRYFMLIPEACKLVLEAGTKGQGGEIFVFDMGRPVKIVDLAKRMIMMSGASNVRIVFTGLRPGEKLYEEVLNSLENSKPSFNKKIRIAEVRQYDYLEVEKDIEELIRISTCYDNMATVRKMKEIVPEYRSKNSVYEELDPQCPPLVSSE